MKRKLFKYHVISLLFFGLLNGLFAQEKPYTIQVDTTQIQIGQPISLDIASDLNQPVFIENIKDLNPFELIGEVQLDTIANQLINRLKITTFEEGRHYIPSLTLQAKDKSYISDSILIQIAEVKVDTVNINWEPIKNIADQPYVFEDFKSYIIWAGILLAVIALVIYILYLLRKNKEKEEVVLAPPYDEASEKLKALDDKKLIEQGEVKAYYIELTNIIRRYYSRTFKIQTLESTSDETIFLLKQVIDDKALNVNKDYVSDLEKLLTQADFVKFAKLYPSDFDIKNDRKITSQLLNNLEDQVIIYHQNNEAEQEKDTVEEMVKEPFLRSKRFKIFAALLLAIGLLAIGYWINNPQGNTFNPIETEQITWDSYDIGQPPITLESPFEFSEQKDLKYPGIISDRIEERVCFGAASTVYGFELKAAAIQFDESSLGMAEMVIREQVQALQNERAISNFEFERAPFTNNEAFGVELMGSFNKESKKYKFDLIFFELQNQIRFLKIVCEDTPENEAIKKRMLNSIKLSVE